MKCIGVVGGVQWHLGDKSFVRILTFFLKKKLNRVPLGNIFLKPNFLVCELVNQTMLQVLDALKKESSIQRVSCKALELFGIFKSRE